MMSCRGCIYKAAAHSGYKCDYLLLTGHSRGCTVEGCTRKETKGKFKRHKPRPVTLPGSLPKTATGQQTPQKIGHKVTFDEPRAMELYREGKSDAEIAHTVGGISRQGILMWRRRRGLPNQVPRSKKKEWPA